MAAAAVAIGLDLAPVVVPMIKPLISSLVVHVEHLFGAKTGPTKFAVVNSATTAIINQLAASGKIPGTIDGISVGTLIESVVQELKTANVLTPDIIPPSVMAGNPVGTVVNVTGTLKLG